MDHAFVAVVPTRPCPLFGRPVHRRDGSHRLRPGASPHAFRIPPRGGHPALRRTTRDGFRSTLAVSGFRLRARVGFSIPFSLPGQRGFSHPAFGYGALHPSASGTLTHLSTALPSTPYGSLRPCASHRYAHPRGSTTWISPFTSRRQVPTFHTRAWLRVTPPLCRVSSRQAAASPWTGPGLTTRPGFDTVPTLSTRSRWFTAVRLSEPYLTRSRRAVSGNAHHPGSLPEQLPVVWSLPLPAGSEGPSLIPCAARLHRVDRAATSRPPLCAVVAHSRPRTAGRLPRSTCPRGTRDPGSPGPPLRGNR